MSKHAIQNAADYRSFEEAWSGAVETARILGYEITLVHNGKQLKITSETTLEEAKKQYEGKE